MQPFIHWLETSFSPRMAKVNNNVWVVSIKDSIMQVLPFILVGSVFAMLAILNERAAAENLPITSHLLAWEDGWEEAGLGENSVDVAFASRSLMSGNVFSAVRKPDAAQVEGDVAGRAVPVRAGLLPELPDQFHVRIESRTTHGAGGQQLPAGLGADRLVGPQGINHRSDRCGFGFRNLGALN